MQPKDKSLSLNALGLQRQIRTGTDNTFSLNSTTVGVVAFLS